MTAQKLYVVVRGDLTPGPQAVQAMHSFRQFVHEHPERERRWFLESNHLALLSVPGPRDLALLQREAALRGLPFSGFDEPDMGGERTSITLSPEARGLCARLPLALRV